MSGRRWNGRSILAPPNYFSNRGWNEGRNDLSGRDERGPRRSTATDYASSSVSIDDIGALQRGDVLSNDRGCLGRLGWLVNSELPWKLLNRDQIEIHRSKKRPYSLNAERVEARLFVLSREDKRGTNGWKSRKDTGEIVHWRKSLD